jgi:alpha-ketoglutarate-dependent taurine dioxygenase
MNQRPETPACPLLVTPEHPGQSLEDWADEHHASVHGLLLVHKALLFRGFSNRGGLETISDGLLEDRLTYVYRSTPRTELGPHIYTATEYPKQLTIPQHNENAYQRSWPMKLLFHCTQPAHVGGRTPLAESDLVTRFIDPSVQEEFERRQVKYVRNYRKGVDLPWPEVFGTSDKDEVEEFCRQQHMSVEWTETGLRTSQVCQAFANHPVTGERLWFNQAHLFHVSALDLPSRQMMLSVFGESGLPRNAYFGDGAPIASDVLDHIRAAYEHNKIFFDWQKDDVLLVDNMLVSHGREPYDGARQVLVCMSEPYSARGFNA